MTALSLVTLTTDNFPLFRRRLMHIERSSFLSPWTLNSFRNELLNPVSRIWGVLADDGLAGFVCFWVVAGEIHLLNIAVAPEKRGRGIGAWLLSRVIERGEDAGVDRIWLEVRPSNSAALAVYRSAGFIEEGRRKGYYSDTGEDAIVMSLFVRPPVSRLGFFQRTETGLPCREASRTVSARPEEPDGLNCAHAAACPPAGGRAMSRF